MDRLKHLYLVFLFVLPSCGIFSAPEVTPVVQAVHGLDAKFQEMREGFGKFLTYGQNNGMPQATWQVYKKFLDERTFEFERLRTAALAALSDLGEVSLAEILQEAIKIAPDVKAAVKGLTTTEKPR